MFNLSFTKDLAYDQSNKTKNNCMNKSHHNNCNCQTNQFDNKFYKQIKFSFDLSSSLHSIVSVENSLQI